MCLVMEGKEVCSGGGKTHSPPPPPRIIWSALYRSVNRYPTDDLMSISSKIK